VKTLSSVKVITVAGQTVELQKEVNGLSVGRCRVDSDVQLVVSLGRGRIDQFGACLTTTHKHLSLLRAAPQLRIDHTDVGAALTHGVTNINRSKHEYQP